MMMMSCFFSSKIVAAPCVNLGPDRDGLESMAPLFLWCLTSSGCIDSTLPLRMFLYTALPERERWFVLKSRVATNEGDVNTK